MSDKSRSARSKMTAGERALRSELTRLLHSEGVLRGNLSLRQRTCGKPTCHCMRSGEKHTALYLVFSEGGKFRQVFVPKEHHEVVRKWVENHKRARDLLEGIAKMHREKIRHGEA